jgi:hypothetical protein
VRPAVKHFAAFDCDVVSCCSRRNGYYGWGDGGSRSSNRSGTTGRRCTGSIVSAVEARSAGGETANASSVAELELGLEESKGPFTSGA